jgi:hypothetical protein
MNTGLKTGPGQIHFEDEFITVVVLRFDPKSGIAEVVFSKRQALAGFYYVTLSFASGDSVRLDYNGENPNNPAVWTPNSAHRDDVLTKVEAVKVR